MRIRKLLLPLTAAACWQSALLTGFDLDAVRQQANPEKRSEMALANADTALDRARDAYEKGDGRAFQSSLVEVDESIVLCKESLDESGKNARRRPKYFKKAEIGIRRLIRRLDNFRVEVSVDDRHMVEPVHTRAQKLQEEILHAIMGKKNN